MPSVSALDPLASAQYVSGLAKHVTVNQQGCTRAAALILESMNDNKYSTQTWSQHELNPKVCTNDNHEDDFLTNGYVFSSQKNKLLVSPDFAVDWIFCIDLLNFSFWSDIDVQDSGSADSQRFAVNYNGRNYTGYWSLVAAINRALQNGIPITSPSFWITEEFSESLLAKVFESATDESVPLLAERYNVLVEAGQCLAKWNASSFCQFVREANGSARDLIKITSRRISSFYDCCEYEGQTVAISKRVQILIADLWACFNKQSWGKFYDIDEAVTMFADYRVPQILYDLGCLDYSPELESHIRDLLPIEHGDPREVELRACSIWAVELIRRCMPAGYNAILIDFYLWDTAKELQKKGHKAIPCHRTRSIYY